MKTCFISPEMHEDLLTQFNVTRDYLENEYLRRFHEHLVVIIMKDTQCFGGGIHGACTDKHTGSVDINVKFLPNQTPPFSIEFVVKEK